MKPLLFMGAGLGAVLVLSGPSGAVAQAPASDPAPAVPARRLGFRPHYAVGQFAGGIGLVSTGLGYRWRGLEAEALIGYVPPKYAGTPLTIFTLKTQYVPFALAVAPRWQVQPLAAGALINHTAGDLVRTRDGKYPAGYYWWSATVRAGAFVGSRLRHRPPGGRSTVFYYELGTNDLYLVNLFGNMRGGVPLGQVLTLGLGVKVDLQR